MGILYKLGLGGLYFFGAVAKSVGMTRNRENVFDSNKHLDKFKNLEHLNINGKSSDSDYKDFLQKLGITQNDEKYCTPYPKKLNEPDLKEANLIKQELAKLRSKLDKARTNLEKIQNKVDIDVYKLDHKQIKQNLDSLNDKANSLLEKYQNDETERDLKLNLNNKHTHTTRQPEARMLDNLDKLEDKGFVYKPPATNSAMEIESQEGKLKIEETQAFDKKWKGKLNIDGDGGKSRRLEKKITSLEDRVDKLIGKYPEGERILGNDEKKLTKKEKYQKIIKDLIKLREQSIQDEKDLCKNLQKKLAGEKGYLKQELELLKEKNQTEDSEKIKAIENKLRSISKIEKSENKQITAEFIKDNINDIASCVAKNWETKDNSELFSQFISPDLRKDIKNNGNPFGKVGTRSAGKLTTPEECEGITESTKTIMNRGHIISQDEIEVFLYKGFLQLPDQKSKLLVLKSILGYTGDCGIVAGNKASQFSSLLERCLIGEEVNVYNKPHDPCIKFISYLTMWNPGNISISPSDPFRVGDKEYPGENVDYRVLAKLNELQDELLKMESNEVAKNLGVDYRKLLKNLREVIAIISSESDYNRAMLGFDNQEVTSLKGLLKGMSITSSNNINKLSDFFEKWKVICEVSRGLYLNEKSVANILPGEEDVQGFSFQFWQVYPNKKCDIKLIDEKKMEIEKQEDSKDSKEALCSELTTSVANNKGSTAEFIKNNVNDIANCVASNWTNKDNHELFSQFTIGKLSSSTKISGNPFRKIGGQDTDKFPTSGECKNINTNKKSGFHRGHIIPQDDIEMFLYSEFLSLAEGQRVKVLTNVFSYMSSCGEVVKNEAAQFSRLLKECLIGVDVMTFSIPHDPCIKFISYLVMWNPGDIAISPLDHFRVGSKKYPGHNIDYRVLAKLNELQDELLKMESNEVAKNLGVDYRKLLKNLREAIAIISSESDYNRAMLGFDNQEVTSLKGLLNGISIVPSNNSDKLSAFFENWKNICEASRGLYLNEKSVIKIIEEELGADYVKNIERWKKGLKREHESNQESLKEGKNQKIKVLVSHEREALTLYNKISGIKFWQEHGDKCDIALSSKLTENLLDKRASDHAMEIEKISDKNEVIINGSSYVVKPNDGYGDCALYAIQGSLENVEGVDLPSNIQDIRKSLGEVMKGFVGIYELPNDVSGHETKIRGYYKKIFSNNFEIFQEVLEQLISAPLKNEDTNEETRKSINEIIDKIKNAENWNALDNETIKYSVEKTALMDIDLKAILEDHVKHIVSTKAEILCTFDKFKGFMNNGGDLLGGINSWEEWKELDLPNKEQILQNKDISGCPDVLAGYVNYASTDGVWLNNSEISAYLYQFGFQCVCGDQEGARIVIDCFRKNGEHIYFLNSANTHWEALEKNNSRTLLENSNDLMQERGVFKEVALPFVLNLDDYFSGKIDHDSVQNLGGSDINNDLF